MTRLIFSTTDVEEWQDFIQSKHKLPLVVDSLNSNEFYSEMSVYLSTEIPGVSFSESKSCSQTFKSRSHKERQDAFLIAHSRDKFSYEGLIKEKFNSGTFMLNLSEPFVGEFIKNADTKSISVPFDLLPGNMVDRFKLRPLNKHPLFFTIDNILRTSSMEDSDLNMQYKIAAIVNLLSIDDMVEKMDIIKDLRLYILRKLIKGERFNLDVISSDFCMSRRKLQYVFSNNKTTYIKTLKEVRLELIRLNKTILIKP